MASIKKIGGGMEEIIEHHGVKGQKWGVRKVRGRKKRQLTREQERERQHKIEKAKASVSAGAEFMKKNAPTIAAATVTVALTGAHMGLIAPLASAAVSTSMNTVAAANKAAKEYDEHKKK